jgi:hypothetical protein
VLQRIPTWLRSCRQDLERGLSRVAAGTAAPAEAVGLWTALAQVRKQLCSLACYRTDVVHCANMYQQHGVLPVLSGSGHEYRSSDA